MSELGPKPEKLMRAYVFRFVPGSGHRPIGSAGPFGADIVAKVPKGAAADFSRKNETSDNRRSMGLQTRYQNRL
jgi:hypothetical protein